METVADQMLYSVELADTVDVLSINQNKIYIAPYVHADSEALGR